MWEMMLEIPKLYLRSYHPVSLLELEQLIEEVLENVIKKACIQEM